MRRTVENAAKLLGWLDTGDFIRVPSKFSGFPVHAIACSMDEEASWRCHTILIAFAAYAKAALAGRAWAWRMLLRSNQLHAIRFTKPGKPGFATRLYPYDPSDAVSEACAIIHVVNEALQIPAPAKTGPISD